MKILLSLLGIIYGSILSAQMSDIQIHNYLNQLNSDSISNHISQLENFQTRWAKDSNHREVAFYIKDKMELYQLRVRIDSFYMYWDTPPTWQYNVVGILDGSIDTNSIYMLGAHYDAINPLDSTHAPGADDNASGMAALFEIARVMKENSYIPTHTIYFIGFAAEEQGLKGSGYEASVICQTKPIVYFLNNDMISNNMELESNWKVKLHTYDNSNDVTDYALEMMNTFTTLTDTIIPDNCNCTDSRPFYDWGAKTIFFHEYNFSPFYHSENDLVANIDKSYCTEVTKISFAMLLKSTSTSTGIEEFTENDVYIFPNPTKDFISINSKDELSFVEIYNPLGIKLKTINSLNGFNRIDLSELTPGMYILETTSNTTKRTLKNSFFFVKM